MDKLKLTFPSPHPGTHLLVETRPDKFAEWLESLPSGNMPRFVTEVADAVTNLNRTDLPIVQRLSLMQQLDMVYSSIHNYYRPLMKSGPHKGNLAPIKELKELYRLTREMSFAYKISVYAYIDKKVFFGKNKNLANAINMALHYLGLELLEQYELYSPIPMYIWREIHQLYYTAESRHLSELSNPDMGLIHCFNVAETTYIRICLMALSNPYHLKRGDHWEVFTYLNHWTIQTIISEDPDDFSDKNCFVIDLDADDKPTTLKTLEDHENPDLRFLLTAQLTIRLAHHIDEIQIDDKCPKNCFSNNVIARKATHLMENMLASWESKQERQNPRYPRIDKMEVIWGLQNIHQVISSTDPILENNLKTNVDNIIEQHWTTINKSDGGTCLARPREKINEIDVGLLVAIRESVSGEANSSWLLGSISWITGNKRNGTQVGIQYMKGDLQAVILQARKGNYIDTGSHMALMLSGEQIHGLLTPTLLTTSGLYIESRPMMLRVGEAEQFIHARLKVGSTGSVDRFFYQTDNQQISTSEQQAESKTENSSDVSSEDEEIINLNAMPMAHAEDFEAAARKERDKRVTLDDMIVPKNK